MVISGTQNLSKDADDLLNAIRKPNALLPLLTTQKILSVLNPIVISLQSIDKSVDEVLKMLKTVTKSLVQIKESQEIWNSIYTRYLKLSSSIKSHSFHSVIINYIFKHSRLTYLYIRLFLTIKFRSKKYFLLSQ